MSNSVHESIVFFVWQLRDKTMTNPKITEVIQLIDLKLGCEDADTEKRNKALPCHNTLDFMF